MIIKTAFTAYQAAAQSIVLWNAMAERVDGSLIVGFTEDGSLDWAVTGTDEARKIAVVTMHEADVPEDAAELADYVAAFAASMVDLPVIFAL